MPTDIAFRLSTYLTLALACATLGYSESDLLPEASICSFIVGGLMILTFSQEGKWELSLTAANRLGLVIGILAAVWIAFQIVRPSGGLIYKLPWPASLLPYIGPLIMVLMPAKLFRPKHVGDWWTMHGVGLAAVALACTLADDLTHGILVALYAVCGAWSLSLFYLRRAAGGVPAIPGQESRTPRSLTVTGDFSSAPKSLLGRAFAVRPVWSMVAAAGLGTIVFFLTPRIEGPTWNLTSTREAGYSAEDAAPDLNREGLLATANREVAFVVTAKNGDGSKKTDVPGDQLWRGRAFIDYRGGKWQPQSAIKPLVSMSSRPTPSIELNQPGIWTADFDWKAKRRDAVLASPVYWRPDRASPVMADSPYGRIVWSQSPDAFFFPVTREGFAKYRQITREPSEFGMGPLFEMTRYGDTMQFDNDPYRELDMLTRCDLPAVRDYARQLLDRLIDQGKLGIGVRSRIDPVSRTVAVEDQDAVAFKIRQFFAESGEFTYDEKAPPLTGNRDPIEEFLLVAKTGTCERFATGLTLVLRSLGIPCRIVIGFKGCEQEDEGLYIIRQEHAHAWVEMLVRRPTPAGVTTSGNPKHLFAWMNLDPTPNDSASSTEDSGLARQVRSFWQSIGDFFSSFIVKYDPAQRDKLWKNLLASLRHGWPVVLQLAAIIVVSYGIWKLARQARLVRVKPVKATTTMPEWYIQFLEIAARRNVERKPSETPIEHARRLAAVLPHGLADHPHEFAAAISAFRYGGVKPDEPRLRAKLAELDTA